MSGEFQQGMSYATWCQGRYSTPEADQSPCESCCLRGQLTCEALDSAITKGRFDEETVLGTLRHLIQHRPRFKVLLSGTHTLDELQRWASYLINVQVVHTSYLKETEARQLVEQPVKDFALRYEPEASQRVLGLTRGHPFLVQLLCAKIVALKKSSRPPSAAWPARPTWKRRCRRP